MGKKNKNTNTVRQSEEQHTFEHLNTGKKRKVISNDESETANVKEIDTSNLKKIKNVRKKIEALDEQEMPDSEQIVIEPNKTKDNKNANDNASDEKRKDANVKRQKPKKNKEVNTVPNKKIIFNDDGTEIEASEEPDSIKTLNFLQGEEADVKDVDIDKFCDEISQEDNLQYENWVKLIEAQLHSSKNKSNKTLKT